MNKIYRPVVITRQHKHEAEQAIADLKERGYEIVYPLTQLKNDGKRFTRDSYNRKVFQENIESSCWVAKLKKVENG